MIFFEIFLHLVCVYLEHGQSYDILNINIILAEAQRSVKVHAVDYQLHRSKYNRSWLSAV